ncbi:unnamed protein product [Lupinus luteus]|uniref:Uncharacterized protein n=1 Tax=Lupinus luteus TaxID=3873 RepID=A0AAV1XSX9_LUPLU
MPSTQGTYTPQLYQHHQSYSSNPHPHLVSQQSCSFQTFRHAMYLLGKSTALGLETVMTVSLTGLCFWMVAFTSLAFILVLNVIEYVIGSMHAILYNSQVLIMEQSFMP